MFKYKTVSCPFNLRYHDKALCVYSHHWQDFRRSPDLYHYEPVQCKAWSTNDAVAEYGAGCPDLLNCSCCHGWKELEYHPLFYKTAPCTTKGCGKTLTCPYYHSSKDRRHPNKELFSKSGDQVWFYVAKNRNIKGTYKNRSNSRLHRQASSIEASLPTSSQDLKGQRGGRNRKRKSLANKPAKGMREKTNSFQGTARQNLANPQSSPLYKPAKTLTDLSQLQEDEQNGQYRFNRPVAHSQPLNMADENPSMDQQGQFKNQGGEFYPPYRQDSDPFASTYTGQGLPSIYEEEHLAPPALSLKLPKTLEDVKKVNRHRKKLISTKK